MAVWVWRGLIKSNWKGGVKINVDGSLRDGGAHASYAHGNFILGFSRRLCGSISGCLVCFGNSMSERFQEDHCIVETDSLEAWNVLRRFMIFCRGIGVLSSVMLLRSVIIVLIFVLLLLLT